MVRFTATPEDDAPWLSAILQRCERWYVLQRSNTGWEVLGADGKLVDHDSDFNALFWRHYDWEEDVPGYEGILWRSPSRCGGRVCIKGTRIWVSMIKACVERGGDPLREWDHLTADKVAAALRYDGHDEPIFENMSATVDLFRRMAQP